MAYFANNDIDYGAEFFECSRAEYLMEIGAVLGKYTSFFNQLNPSTEYIAILLLIRQAIRSLLLPHLVMKEHQSIGCRSNGPIHPMLKNTG